MSADFSQLCSRRCRPCQAARRRHRRSGARRLVGRAPSRRLAFRRPRSTRRSGCRSRRRAVVTAFARLSVGPRRSRRRLADFERLVPVSLGSAKPPLGFRQFQTIDLGYVEWDTDCLTLIDDLLERDRIALARQRARPREQRAEAAAESVQQKASVCVLPFSKHERRA